MIRRALVVALLLVHAPAAAGVGGEIAYSLLGGREIYLVNRDGSGKRLLYRAAAKKTILAIDIKPDGGELSFEEVNSTGQTATLKTLSYGASGLGTVIRSIAGGRFQMDTAADGSLLFVDSLTHDVRRVAPGSSAAVSVGVPRYVSKVSWLPDGSFVYASPPRIWRATLSEPSGTILTTLDCVASLEGAHAANEALATTGSACGSAGIRRLIVSPPSLSAVLSPGSDASYSPDDACFIYITPAQARGSYLRIKRIDGAGTPLNVGGRAQYASVDWRGDSSPAACPVANSSAFDFRTP